MESHNRPHPKWRKHIEEQVVDIHNKFIIYSLILIFQISSAVMETLKSLISNIIQIKLHHGNYEDFTTKF